MIEVRVRMETMEPEQAILLCTCKTVEEALNVAASVAAVGIFFEHGGRHTVQGEDQKPVGQFVVTDKWAGFEIILEATE